MYTMWIPLYTPFEAAGVAPRCPAINWLFTVTDCTRPPVNRCAFLNVSKCDRLSSFVQPASFDCRTIRRGFVLRPIKRLPLVVSGPHPDVPLSFFATADRQESSPPARDDYEQLARHERTLQWSSWRLGDNSLPRWQTHTHGSHRTQRLLLKRPLDSPPTYD